MQFGQVGGSSPYPSRAVRQRIRERCIKTLPLDRVIVVPHLLQEHEQNDSKN